MDNYVCYHLHTDRSIGDSCTGYEDYIEYAALLGQTAIAFTEHGNIYNWIEKKMCCESYGLKYIHGIECYLTESLDTLVRDNYHTILLAKNYEGVKEINRLVDLSTTESHFYYKPRLTFDEFLSISPNVICISACLASPLAKITDHTTIERLCGRYDYFEVQPHVNSEAQKEYNRRLVALSERFHKPLIAGTDTHALNTYKAECRKMRMLAKDISFAEEDEFDLTYKSREELEALFSRQNVLSETQIRDALDNTVRMAESVEEFQLDTTFKYPVLYPNEDEVLVETLKRKYTEKVASGIIEDNPIYWQNINEELRVFRKIGMIGFMLFMSELISWCWEHDIPTSYCRGSVGGSTVAYILDIIDVNPVRWHTMFSRFANEDRKEIGDIDVDLPPTKRALVYDHIISEFGTEKTAYILSLGTVAGKGVIDEIGRGLNNQWRRHNSSGESPYDLKTIEAVKTLYTADPDAAREAHPDIFYYFDGMVDTVVSQSMHPAGIIVSPVTLPDNYGTFHADGKRILSINMEEVHEVSLVKYDLLGLKNVEIISDTCEFAGIPYPKSHLMDWEDPKVWGDLITNPTGIFQFESDFAFDSLKRFQPKRINDLSLLNAALRPSGESYRDRLIAREHNKNPSEIIDEMLSENNGFLVFQEDVIRFLQEICGLSGSEADNIRRAIGRKQKDRLDAALPQIFEGYCSKSKKPRAIAEQEAKTFLQIIEDSASYMFGRNHSTGYSMVGYTCAYLRYYYPAEFIAAYLNNSKDQSDINAGTQLARQRGIEIRPIQFLYSGAKYIPDAKNRAIYKGLSSIKYIGTDVADALYAMREDPPMTFLEFLQRSPLDSRQVRILIRLNFFAMYGQSAGLMDELTLFERLYSKKDGQWIGRRMFKKDDLDAETADVFRKHSKETEKQFQVQDMDAVYLELAGRIEDRALPPDDVINAQVEFLGYIEARFPNMVNRYFVLDVDTKYTPRLTLYELSSGETVIAKIARRDYQEQPVSKGETLHIYRMVQKPKRVKEGDEWRVVDGVFDTWIDGYRRDNGGEDEDT